jgi:hypothetical protein
MTAQPEKVDVKHVVGQMTPPRTNPSVQTFPTAATAARLWRVVAADGSTRVFDFASPVDCPDNQEPAANAETPSRPQLSDMLAAGVEQSSPGGGQSGRVTDARNLDAVMVLGTDGKCGLGRARRSEGVAATSDLYLAKSVISPQLSACCRDIDSRLARIINLWPQLPRSIQVAALAMIEAALEHQ